MNNDNDKPTTALPATTLLTVDLFLDATDRAILAAKDVFVSDETRAFAASVRAELYRGAKATRTTERVAPTHEPSTSRWHCPGEVAVLGRNIMVGLVQQALEELGEEPGDGDALALVRSWIERSKRGDDDEALLHSPLHLIVGQRTTRAARSVGDPAPDVAPAWSAAELRRMLAALVHIAPIMRRPDRLG
jgi:hypothetical protein